MSFYLYNTMSRKKEEFVPVHHDLVTMYTCGLTVYNYAHIGNLRTYIFEDVLKKALLYAGYKVKHVMNITDVGHLESDADEGEDKMALGASREKISPMEIARMYERAFVEDLHKLNLKLPEVMCRATEHIDDMIALIKKLEEKGFTYVSNGNVYFDISKFPDYNKLAALPLDELQSGARIEIDVNKINPLDFVLWFTNSKFKNHIMQWESPWGTGFPGWHIECSAMAIKYLGEYVDIHCGGVDHIPVHHTNEIAQSEAALGHKWVNYWLHGEFLVIDGGKMSKSTGKFLTVNTLIEEGFSALDYKYFCLQSRYRKQLAFSLDALREAQSALKKLKRRISSIAEASAHDASLNEEAVNSYKVLFLKHIGDDLNIPNAFTVLSDVLKDDSLNNLEKLHLIEDFDKVFSLGLLTPDTQLADIDEHTINELISQRNEARKNKDWKLADALRDKLLESGIEIKDSKEGTSWTVR